MYQTDCLLQWCQTAVIKWTIKGTINLLICLNLLLRLAQATQMVTETIMATIITALATTAPMMEYTSSSVPNHKRNSKQETKYKVYKTKGTCNYCTQTTSLTFTPVDE